MLDAYIYDGKRTPFGRYGGSLSSVRPDDLLGSVIKTSCRLVGRLADYDARSCVSTQLRQRPYRGFRGSSVRHCGRRRFLHCRRCREHEPRTVCFW